MDGAAGGGLKKLYVYSIVYFKKIEYNIIRNRDVPLHQK